MSKSLTWNQRLAIINKFNPSDDQIKSTFGVTQGELDAARSLQSTGGQFVPVTNFDVDSYEHLFASTSVTKPDTNTTTVTSTTKPITATKKTKNPARRGRKGDRIKNAFAAIPSTPVAAEQFAVDNAVSLFVLRQSKRFDTQADTGPVRVKKVLLEGADDKVLCIWREAPTSE